MAHLMLIKLSYMQVRWASAFCSSWRMGKENLFPLSFQMNEVEGGRTQDLCPVLKWPLGGSVTPRGPCLLPAPVQTEISGPLFGDCLCEVRLCWGSENNKSWPSSPPLKAVWCRGKGLGFGIHQAWIPPLALSSPRNLALDTLLL